MPLLINSRMTYAKSGAENSQKAQDSLQLKRWVLYKKLNKTNYVEWILDKTVVLLLRKA